jgi:hypothetical protein
MRIGMAGIRDLAIAKAPKEQAHKEIKLMCEQCSGMELPQHLQFMLTKPLEETLKLPTSVLRVWMLSYRPLLEKETETNYSEDLAAG